MTNIEYSEQAQADTVSDEVFTIPVKAGKRIYYFDVKSTRMGDYYITITESRKRAMRDGTFVIDKHKIHLYKEDFDKFSEALTQALNFIKFEAPAAIETEQQPLNTDNTYKSECPSSNGYSARTAGLSTMSDDDFFNSL